MSSSTASMLVSPSTTPTSVSSRSSTLVVDEALVEVEGLAEPSERPEEPLGDEHDNGVLAESILPRGRTSRPPGGLL